MESARICPICRKPILREAPQGLCPHCLLQTGFDTRAQDLPGGVDGRFVPPRPEQIGSLFPQLEITGLLGQGGMGAVYKARQPALGRFVALKILPPKNGEDPGFAERFTREARALARLNHPNIVAVYDFGHVGGMSYFLMEYVEGTTLRQFARSGRVSPRETLSIITQICEALQFAHDEGIVHRDIKPENILIDHKARAKIADFGIAKVLNRDPQDIALTGAKEIVGTAHYMAPEQFEHPENVDHRADIFSLGVVFYELLTGELPLGRFVPPSQKASTDARLDEVVLHTLAKEPDRRYQRASQLKRDVQRIAAKSDRGNGAQRTPDIRLPTQASKSPAHQRFKGWNTVLLLVAGGFAVSLLISVAASGLAKKAVPAPVDTTAGLSGSNAFWAALNDDQRLVAQWTQRKYSQFNDGRTFYDWSQAERYRLEQRALDTLRGPRSIEVLQAINTLAALHSTNAVPRLRELAFEGPDKLALPTGGSTSRFLATRALGGIGDNSVVPDLIHLLYRNNSVLRWCAQISLVQLTGQNFGADWRAWGNWWNSQGGHPPFNPQMIRWWTRQPEADELARIFSKIDRRFIATLKTRSPRIASRTEPEEPDEQLENATP